MNLPNKLTLTRVIMIPLFLFFFLADFIPFHFLIAFLFFLAASLTDYLDGYLARKHQLVTTFGKFLDPLADKMLVTSALLCFADLKLCPIVAVILIILRDFAVDALRLLALSESGRVIAAAQSGRVKTALQMAVLSALQLTLGIYAPLLESTVFRVIAQAAFWILAAVTVYSGIEYLYRNRQLFLKSR